MLDQWRIDNAVSEANRTFTESERQRIVLLMEMDEARRGAVKRFLAGSLVRLGLRLDPEVLTAMPVRTAPTRYGGDLMGC